MKSRRNQSLVFIFPFRGPGGVSYLFGRFADHFTNIGFEVSVIDYCDGSLARYVSNKVEIIDYENIHAGKVLEFDYAIFQSMTPWSLFDKVKLNPSTKLIFITTLVENFYIFLPGVLRSIIANSPVVRNLIWNTILKLELLKTRQFIGDLECNNYFAWITTSGVN